MPKIGQTCRASKRDVFIAGLVLALREHGAKHFETMLLIFWEKVMSSERVNFSKKPTSVRI